MSIALERRGEWWWPVGETGCWSVVHREAEKLDTIIGLCRHRRLCVQAGANAGVVPLRLAASFDSVLAFEPDLPNFCAASRNLAERQNVTLYMAALGERQGSCHMARPDGETQIDVVSNRGALQTRVTGIVPVMTIDQLDLPVCDLIMLDIEGDEWLALRGAVRTISHYRPVIVAEDKNLGRRRGASFGALAAWLCGTFGYRTAGMIGNDFVFTAQEV